MAAHPTEPSVRAAARATQTNVSASAHARSILEALDHPLELTAKAQVPGTDRVSHDALLMGVLALLSESSDVSKALQQTLDLITSSLACRVGEIWLRSGETRDVELQYSSADGSAGVMALACLSRARRRAAPVRALRAVR